MHLNKTLVPVLCRNPKFFHLNFETLLECTEIVLADAWWCHHSAPVYWHVIYYGRYRFVGGTQQVSCYKLILPECSSDTSFVVFFVCFLHAKIRKVIYLLLQVVYMSSKWSRRPVQTAFQSVRAATMAFVPAPSPTVVDQTTLMKKYLQFVAALTDANTRKFINLAVYFLVSDVWKIWKKIFSFRKYLFDFFWGLLFQMQIYCLNSCKCIFKPLNT